jgi:HSP20 family protein
MRRKGKNIAESFIPLSGKTSRRLAKVKLSQTGGCLMDERGNNNWLSPFDRDVLDRPISQWSRMFFNEMLGRMGPSIDLHEDPHGFTLTAEMPGINPEDIDITVDEQAVTIKGESRRTVEKDDKGYKMSERRYGNFYRTVSLPTEVIPDQAVAEYENGVLEIKLTKSQPQEDRSRRIKVNGKGKPNPS